MKQILTAIVLVTLLAPALTLPANAFALVNQSYFYDNGPGDESFKDNYEKVDVVSPQVYYIDYDFDLEKTDDKGVIRKADRERVKIVPLIFQKDFSRQLMSQILADEDIWEDIVDDLIDEAEDEDYAGWQFDFENIAAADRDAFTEFVEFAAKEFDDERLEFSVAVIPRTSPYDLNSPIQDLTAAYDYEALADAADYLVAMAYNDPNSFGPTGSLPYQRAVLDFMTTIVPEDKLHLGIPLYCSKWRVNGGYARFGALPHSDVEEEVGDSRLLLRGYMPGVESEYAAYIVPSGNVYITWCDSEKGFDAKMKLAKQYDLRGISMWALGQEDEDMWRLL